MIFNKIFNTIRFNLALPSYLIKNKFIIERNNKFKNIFSTLNFIFKTSSWSFTNSINMDNIFNVKNFIKYSFFIIFISIVFIHKIDSVLLTYVQFTIWKSSSLLYIIAINFYLYTFFIFKIISDIFFIFFSKFFYINNSWTKRISKKQTNYTYDKTHFSKMFKNINYSENFINILNNTFNYNNSNKNFNILFKKLYNVLDLNINEVSPIKSININKFNSYTIQEDFKNLKNDFILQTQNVSIIDNNVQNLNKLNFNFINLKLNFLQNIEYYKWLYKYSLIHSRSFTESQYLNLKIAPIGSNFNTYNTLQDGTIFNYYFNSLDYRFKLNTIKFDFNNVVNNTFINKLYLPNNWMHSFSSLNTNFKWYQDRYTLTNEFYFKNLINRPQLNFNLNFKFDKKVITKYNLSSDDDLFNITNCLWHFKIFNLINQTSYFINLPKCDLELNVFTFKNDLKKIIFLNNEFNNK